MQTKTRHILRFGALVVLTALCGAGVCLAYADCRWVGLGVDSRRICEENDTAAKQGPPKGQIFSMAEVPGVTMGRVSAEPIARSEQPVPAKLVVQAVPVISEEQEEPRKAIERARQRAPERRRRPAHPQLQWASQRFGTNVMGARVKGTFERRGEDVRGVVYVYPPFGGKNTYHFTGKIQGNHVTASHHSGHVFRGEIVGGRRVVGAVTTRSGARIPLDVPLGSQ